VTTFIGKAASKIVQRFPDAGIELAYMADQRGRQARFTKAMVVIILVAMLMFVATSFAFLRGDALKTVGLAQLYFLPLLFVYAWALGRPSYLTNPWIDVIFFVAIQPGLYVNNLEMIASGVTGWGPSAQFCYGLLLTMAFGCLAFAAAVGAYFVLSLASIAYFIWLLSHLGIRAGELGFSLNSYGTFIALLMYVNWAIDDKARRLFKMRQDLKAEKAKSDRLLDAVLPAEIAQRLRENEEVADDFHGVAIVFADIVGFTRLSEQLGPRRTVEMLNTFFNRCDHGTEIYGMEKIKTIGDCYMAVAGALTTPTNPAKAAVDFAAYLVREAHVVGKELGLDLKVRVGINAGEVVGGVISTKRLSYDYWGDAINVAARLQGLAAEDGIAVSESVYEAARDSYAFHPKREAHMKNLGNRPVYDVALDLEAAEAA
jgi:adenylate cyclase